MNRPVAWQAVLERETARWAAAPFEEIVAALQSHPCYTAAFEEKAYQVEIEALSEDGDSLQVMVAVDDGSLPASLIPRTQVFVCAKPRLDERRS